MSQLSDFWKSTNSGRWRNYYLFGTLLSAFCDYWRLSHRFGRFLKKVELFMVKYFWLKVWNFMKIGEFSTFFDTFCWIPLYLLSAMCFAKRMPATSGARFRSLLWVSQDECLFFVNYWWLGIWVDLWYYGSSKLTVQKWKLTSQEILRKSRQIFTVGPLCTEHMEKLKKIFDFNFFLVCRFF